MDFEFLKAAHEAGAKLEYLVGDNWEDVPEVAESLSPKCQYRLKIKKLSYENLRLAYESGAEIQFSGDGKKWKDTSDPKWLENIQYRLKPKPTKPHKHQSLIDAHAKGARIQFLSDAGDWIGIAVPSWDEDVEYRIKPDPHPHAEVIKAWADGEKIELLIEEANEWIYVKNPAWDAELKYRIKK